MFIKEKYLELLYQFPPRTIHSEKELEATQEIVNSLLDKPELTLEEEEYLNLLGTLIYEYEQTLEPIPDIYGVELLKVLLEERGLKQKDLISIFKTESIISEILNEKRELTKRHIEELAAFFNLPVSVFFPRQSDNF